MVALLSARLYYFASAEAPAIRLKQAPVAKCSAVFIVIIMIAHESLSLNGISGGEAPLT